MSGNQLKRFPTATLRRGLVHFHPITSPGGRGPAGPAPAAVERERDHHGDSPSTSAEERTR